MPRGIRALPGVHAVHEVFDCVVDLNRVSADGDVTRALDREQCGAGNHSLEQYGALVVDDLVLGSVDDEARYIECPDSLLKFFEVETRTGFGLARNDLARCFHCPTDGVVESFRRVRIGIARVEERFDKAPPVIPPECGSVFRPYFVAFFGWYAPRVRRRNRDEPVDTIWVQSRHGDD